MLDVDPMRRGSGAMVECLVDEYDSMPRGLCKAEVRLGWVSLGLALVLTFAAPEAYRYVRCGVFLAVQRALSDCTCPPCVRCIHHCNTRLLVRSHTRTHTHAHTHAQTQVFRKMKLQAQDLFLAPALAAACKRDVDDFCAAVPRTGAGLVHECLRDHLEQLSADCRVAEQAQMRVESGHPQLKIGLLTRCAADLTTFCADVTGVGVGVGRATDGDRGGDGGGGRSGADAVSVSR